MAPILCFFSIHMSMWECAAHLGQEYNLNVFAFSHLCQLHRVICLKSVKFFQINCPSRQRPWEVRSSSTEFFNQLILAIYLLASPRARPGFAASQFTKYVNWWILWLLTMLGWWAKRVGLDFFRKASIYKVSFTHVIDHIVARAKRAGLDFFCELLWSAVKVEQNRIWRHTHAQKVAQSCWYGRPKKIHITVAEPKKLGEGGKKYIFFQFVFFNQLCSLCTSQPQCLQHRSNIKWHNTNINAALSMSFVLCAPRNHNACSIRAT